MKLPTTIGALLCAGASTLVASSFVAIEQLDEVLQNYNRSAGTGWATRLFMPVEVKIATGSVWASAAAIVPYEGAEKAFDGNPETKYCTRGASFWLQQRFAAGKRQIAAYGLTSANDFPIRDPHSWKLLGSNDGKQWELVDQRSNETFSARFQRRQFKVEHAGEYAWYKLEVTHNNGAGLSQLADLSLWTADELKTLQPLAKPQPKPKPPAVEQARASAWQPLFTDLSEAEFPAGVWTLSNGELTASQDKLILTKEEYENFVLDLEFKNGPAANSGVFVYVTDPRGWVKNSVEIQITDDASDKWAKANPTWKCGAIFGRLAASESMVKPAGEWNRYTIICKGPSIDVILNGTHVNSMDMRKWDSPTHNPDMSKKPPWLSKPLNNHPTKGRIGFQGKHGGAPIWFRNVRIKQLD
jgi:hypothetical protein